VFGTQRLTWLEETLAREPDRRTILFIHHPPFDIAPHYVGGYRRPEEAEDLAAVVSRHPQVERLLCGHVHRLHREHWGGTVATTMPSVAVDLRKGVDDAIAAAPLYLLHIASSDGRLVSHTRVVTSRF
jgi:3',5'-cyclic AMP phosphodiesterase CpdA